MIPQDTLSESDIDKEMSRCLQKIAKLASNSFAPIARLPPELLLRMFFLCASQEVGVCAPISSREDEDAGTTAMKHIKPGSKKNGLINAWFKVTHVCRYWRTVAHGCSALWSNLILVYGSEWLDQMLALSKQTPLTIKTDILGRAEFNSLKAALEHISRIRTLDISGPFVDAFFADMTISEAPILEVLSLKTQWTQFVYRRVPGDLFRGITPRLQSLLLHGFALDWDAPFFLENANITHLEIHGLPRSSRPTISQLRTLLSNMHRLKCLDLADSLPAHSDGAAVMDEMGCTYEPLILGYVSELKITGSSSECAQFMHNVYCPGYDHQCSLQLGIHICPLKSAELFHALSEIQSCLKNHVFPICLLHIATYQQDSLHIRGYTEEDDVPGEPYLDVSVFWTGRRTDRNPAEEMLEILFGICSILDLSLLYDLWLEDLEVEDANTWRLFTGFWDTISELRLIGKSAYMFIEALNEECALASTSFGRNTPTLDRLDALGAVSAGNTGSSSTRPSDSVFLPNLRYVELVDVDFGHLVEEPGSAVVRPFWYNLLEYLRSRQHTCVNSDTRIEKLRYLCIGDYARVDQEIIEKLLEAVDIV